MTKWWVARVTMNEQFLITLGKGTTEAEYPVRADTVLKWWGLWGLMWFKTGYEQRGKHETTKI